MTRKLRMVSLLLALLLIVPTVCAAQSFDIPSLAPGYTVPNLENAAQLTGEDHPFQVAELGDMAAGDLDGKAYTIVYTGTNDTTRQKLAALVQQQYDELEKETGVSVQHEDVKVNGTDALLYTYPNGGRVLYALALADTEPLMLIEQDCQLTLAEGPQKTDFVIDIPTQPVAKSKTLPPKFGRSGSVGYIGFNSAVYNFTGTSSDVGDYIIKLVDAGYQMSKQEVGTSDITMVFYNEAEDIELEIEQMLSYTSSASTILITYYGVCPDGEIVDGKIVTK